MCVCVLKERAKALLAKTGVTDATYGTGSPATKEINLQAVGPWYLEASLLQHRPHSGLRRLPYRPHRRLVPGAGRDGEPWANECHAVALKPGCHARPELFKL